MPEAARRCILPTFGGMQQVEEKDWRMVWPKIMEMSCDITEVFTEDWKETRKEKFRRRREAKAGNAEGDLDDEGEVMDETEEDNGRKMGKA